MSKINGKYKQVETEDLLSHINNEDSISKRHRLLPRYFHQRCKQIEKILANIEDDDIDLVMVIEQLWDDLKLARNHFLYADLNYKANKTFNRVY